MNKNSINDQQEKKKLEISNSDDQITNTQEPADSSKEKVEELDPTHFGDWQIGCKTIDF